MAGLLRAGRDTRADEVAPERRDWLPGYGVAAGGRAQWPGCVALVLSSQEAASSQTSSEATILASSDPLSSMYFEDLLGGL